MEINIEKMVQDAAEKVMHDLMDNGVFIGRWIPVSERLPDIPDGEDWVRCLCYGEMEITPDHVDDPNTVTRIEIVAYFKRWGWDGWFHPIAWMPLPEPYKEESEEVCEP